MTIEFADETLRCIEFTTDIGALQDTDFIVEAIIENMALKEDLYTTLGELCKPETIFASNTSSLSIGEMAAFSGRPQNFVGVHFFNPVQVRYVGTCIDNKTNFLMFLTVHFPFLFAPGSS